MTFPLIDSTLTAQQNLLAMINTGAVTPFTGTEFTIGPANAYVPDNIFEITNTEVTLTGAVGTNWEGSSKTFRYSRLALGTTIVGAPTSFNVAQTSGLSDIAQYILIGHGLVASEISIVGDIPPLNQSRVWTVTANDGNLLYTGTLYITINVTE